MRLFLAHEVPAARKLSLEKALRPLRLRLRGARWLRRESWHVTLKFLGEVADERVGEVEAVAGAVAAAALPSTTALTGVGAFPSARRARVLWVGLEDPGGTMAGVAAALEEELGRAGFRQESRTWTPHLTLARFRVPGPIGDVLEEVGELDLDRAPWEVGEVVLFRSHLRREGAVYEPVARLPLGAG